MAAAIEAKVPANGRLGDFEIGIVNPGHLERVVKRLPTDEGKATRGKGSYLKNDPR